MNDKNYALLDKINKSFTGTALLLAKTAVPFFVIALIIHACATPVAPTGGPKDETPPVVVESQPENYSTGFDGDEFRITFNEFVQLKEINSKLLISPPLENTPEFKIRGKSVVVQIEDTLAKNTTYSFYFDDAIVDLHESNPLENFRFVFSTGNELDSMKISGRVIDAFTLKPVEKVLVMLYKKHADSVPLKQIPFYLSKTDDQGNFTITNLANTSYKIFALKDANSNYLFDLPNEKIAFSDTLITPNQVAEMKTFTETDTISSDTTDTNTLTADPDTTFQKPGLSSGDSLIMRFFKERDTALRLTTSKMNLNKNITLGFNKKIDSLNINLIKPDLGKDWFIEEWPDEKDSVLLWLKDFASDSLVMELKADTLLHDTLTYTYFPSEKERETHEKQPLTLKAQLDGQTQLLKHPLLIQTNHPFLKSFGVDSLSMFSSTDTTKVAFEKSGLRELKVDFPWKESENYRIIVPDSVFTSIYSKGNDSTQIRFNTKTMQDYGTLVINISCDTLPGKTHAYLQLLSEDEKTIHETLSVKNDTTWEIDLLNPGKYKLKGILDKNNNEKWDSGIYLKGEQPERVFYYDKVLEVIGNWDVEEDWKIEP
ncbi:MAG: Ig-like domain-containing protein [Bacteroidota bacterium]